MADNSIRKTQARAAERESRRQREERNKKLSIVIPLAIIAMIVVLAIGYSFFTQTNQPANAGVAGPRLQVDRDQIDLGKQRLDNSVRAVFNLKNVGDGTLTLNVPRTVTLLQGC